MTLLIKTKNVVKFINLRMFEVCLKICLVIGNKLLNKCFILTAK